MRLLAPRVMAVAVAVAITGLPAPILSQELSATQRAAIDGICARFDRAGTPGVSVAVTHGGHTLFAKGYGRAHLEYDIPITPQTVFHVASVTKQFVAMALVLLAAEDKLSLDDDVRKHVPWVPDFGAKITIRHLLTHTSGLRDQWELLVLSGYRLDDVLTQEHILRLLRHQRELNFPPGSRYLYSNMGFTLAAHIVQVTAGQSLDDFCRARLFKPLGMSSTHVHIDHRRIVPDRAYSYGRAQDGWHKGVLSYANAGATSLFTTAPDLARWLDNLGTGKVGGKAAIATLSRRGQLAGGTKINYALGLMWGAHRGRQTLGHGGADAGFRADVVWFGDQRLGVAVLSNAATTNPAQLARAIADVVLDVPARKRRASEPFAAVADSRPAIWLDPETFSRYVGRYGKGLQPRFEISRQGDRLFARVGNQRWSLSPASKSEFFARGTKYAVRFALEGKGKDPAASVFLLEGERSTRSDRVPTVAPGTPPPDYAGRYYCPELEVYYQIRIEGDRVFARHRRHGDIELRLRGKDGLAGRPWYFRRLRFERTDGRITGFRLDGSRVLNLRFVRQD